MAFAFPAGRAAAKELETDVQEGRGFVIIVSAPGSGERSGPDLVVIDSNVLRTKKAGMLVGNARFSDATNADQRRKKRRCISEPCHLT